MLRPVEFSVGPINTVSGLSLVLPRSKYDDCAIIAPTTEGLAAVSLEGEHAFHSFNCSDNQAWKGLLIPNISIEVDEANLFDPAERTVLGSLVRSGSTLAIITRSEGAFGRQIHVPLIIGLSNCGESLSAGFKRWTVTVGEGLSRRELKTIEITVTSLIIQFPAPSSFNPLATILKTSFGNGR